ncbi:MAG TPA: YdeI/OmpD-associated family protein [Streptosporangiaceae bacterium]|nr:YdeI/OmpD-associated family protein [Streptosporangiaceae bacterium]
MRVQRFGTHVTSDSDGRAVVALPFDPDETWGAKAYHLVGGTIDPVAGTNCNRPLRGKVTPDGNQWVFTLNPTWMQATGVAVGDEVLVELGPEGPLRGDLADDIAAALDANPAAAAFFDTLAQFYRKAYLRWIDATTRKPELRAARIAEVVALLAAGVKERPRP